LAGWSEASESATTAIAAAMKGVFFDMVSLLFDLWRSCE
jgi:hypothetical protein